MDEVTMMNSYYKMPGPMSTRILILGAGFGGLELSTTLSEALGDGAQVTLVDKADAFIFGYSKLDVMFGRATVEAVRLPYRDFVKPGVTVKRETVTSIDPVAKRVTTDAGTHDADVLVIALGADYDVSTTPGITLGVNEFYSVAGATHLRDVLPTFTKGHAVVGVCGAPYKCPPAPSECVLMLHDYLAARGVRGGCTITLVNPLPTPVPPSPETSQALIAEFAARGIDYLPNRRVTSVDDARKVVGLDDGSELPCELFLGVPKNRAPDVVVATGLTENGWDRPAHARDEGPGGLRARRSREHGRAQGGRLRRGRGPRRRREPDRPRAPAGAHGQEPRPRLLLHRVRRRPHLARRRRLLLGAEAHGDVLRALR
jgi:sulfide:quinone oxidoreductase